jgi:hypothetical protein
MAINRMWNYTRKQGTPLFIRHAPEYVDVAHFSGAGSQDIDVPTGAKFVLFAGTTNFWVKPGGSAAVPSGDITDGSGSELNPSGYELSDISTLGIAVGAAGHVTCTFYSE